MSDIHPLKYQLNSCKQFNISRTVQIGNICYCSQYSSNTISANYTASAAFANRLQWLKLLLWHSSPLPLCNRNHSVPLTLVQGWGLTSSEIAQKLHPTNDHSWCQERKILDQCNAPRKDALAFEDWQLWLCLWWTLHWGSQQQNTALKYLSGPKLILGLEKPTLLRLWKLISLRPDLIAWVGCVGLG